MLHHYKTALLALTVIWGMGGCKNHHETEADNNTSIVEWEKKENISLHHMELESILFENYERQSGKHSFTFSPSAPLMEKEDIIIFQRSVRFPYGLLRKIDAVDVSEKGNLLVSTHPASLTDIFSKLHIHAKQTLSPTKIVKGWGDDLSSDNDKETLHVLSEYEGVSVSLDNNGEIKEGELGSVLSGVKVSLGDLTVSEKIKFDGDMHVSPSVDISIDVEESCHVVWDGWHSHIDCHTVVKNTTHFTGDLSLWGSFKVSAVSGVNITQTFPLATFTFGAIDIQAGPVPLVFIPQASVNLAVSVLAKADISMGINYNFKAKEGVSHGSGDWAPVSSFTPNVTPIPPSADGQVGLRTGIDFNLGLYLYDVVGPWLTIEPYLQAEYDLEEKDMKYYWGVEGDASFGAKFLSYTIAKITYDILEVKEEINTDD